MSSRHRHTRQWEGPAFFLSAPTLSVAVMVREGPKDAVSRFLPFLQTRTAGCAWFPLPGSPAEWFCAWSLLKTLLDGQPRGSCVSLLHRRGVSVVCAQPGGGWTPQSAQWNPALRGPDRCCYFKFLLFLFLWAVLWSSAVPRLSCCSVVVHDHHLVPSSAPLLHTQAQAWLSWALCCGALQNSHSLEENCFVLLYMIVMSFHTFFHCHERRNMLVPCAAVVWCDNYQ